MTAPNYCGQCGRQIRTDDRGERRCENGHRQTEAASLVAALRDLVPVLRDVRGNIQDEFEQQRIELRSLREEVEALRAEGGGLPEKLAHADELVELPEMARRLKVSADWLRRHAEELGGRQSKKGGRWKFHPPTTLDLFGAPDLPHGLDRVRRHDLPPRPLPSTVPLLPVKDQAA